MPDPDREVLESWKEIAAYLGRSVRAAQLWEKDENLPVHRHQHDKQGTVYAYRDEIDRWREARSSPPPEPPPIAAAPPRRGLQFAGAIALAVIVIATLTGVMTQRRQTYRSSGEIESLAVLPFTHGAGVGEHVSDGMTELLIDDLAMTSRLRVMARGSVFHFKGKSIPPARVGGELRVNAVVIGDVRRERDRYVVHAELIDTRDGAQLWAGRYETTPAELAFVQRRVFADLSSRLRGGVTARPKHTPRAEAYEEYLLGLREWNQRWRDSKPNTGAVKASVGHFQRAIELDPQFAAAHAGLANAYGVMVGYDELPPGEGTILAIASARKALELDPNNVEAHTSIAAGSFNNLWDFEGAERSYRHAIALNPNYATAHQWYGLSLQELGRFEEARREIEIAHSLDPLSHAITNSRCWNLYFARRYTEAVAFAKQIEARDPDRTLQHCRSAALLAMGNLDAFLTNLETRKAPFAKTARESVRRGGMRGLYEARLRVIMERFPEPDKNALTIARHHAILGRADEAFAWLEKAYRRRDADMPEFHIHPEFDAIRDDPRFHDLARRIGLPPSALERSRALAGGAAHAMSAH